MRLPSWRKALPWVLLVISLAGNGFFFTGQWFAERKRMAPEIRLLEQVNMTDSQRQAAKEARKEVINLLKQMNDRNRPHFDRFWIEMAKPQPDREVLDRELWAATLGRFEVQRQISDETMDFLGALGPDQRAAAVSLVRGRDGFLPGLLMWDWSGGGRIPRMPGDRRDPPPLPIPPRPPAP
ncbi:hypothetical protein ACFSM5_04850 [Lacibacterium aquatile]|uniref:Periplasmic heavy metal sensor n=1 Tax=Lacibacterium aquatile TaxID=1168082 RepID=A0ABW5DRP5_9PROT